MVVVDQHLSTTRTADAIAVDLGQPSAAAQADDRKGVAEGLGAAAAGARGRRAGAARGRRAADVNWGA